MKKLTDQDFERMCAAGDRLFADVLGEEDIENKEQKDEVRSLCACLIHECKRREVVDNN